MFNAIRTGGQKMAMLIVALAAILAEPFTQMFRLAMRYATPRRYALPRVIKFAQHPFVKRGRAKLLAGGSGFRFALRLAAFAVVIFVSIVTAVHTSGYALALVAAASTRDLKTILTELKTIQDEWRGKAMTTEVGEKFEALAAEAKAIQDESDRDRQIKDFERFGAEVPETNLPPDTKGSRKGSDDEVIGYLPLGHAFVNSPEYKALQEAGFPSQSQIYVAQNNVAMFGKGGRAGAVPITRKQWAELQQKATATTNTGVLRPMRDTEVVRLAAAEFDTLTIRDLINVSQTDAASVEYITLDSLTRAAAPVAESAAKPEATFAMSLATAPVRTIAVTMPVTEQQLQDVPQMQNLIDEELNYDLKKQEEEQLVWGRGTGQNLLGIMKTTGVVAARVLTVPASPTLLDEIRAAITDIAVNGRATANGVAVHPYDWEAIVLLKATTNEYIWVVVTDNQGGSRIWGLRVVETIAMTDVLDVTNTTKQRVVLVGDFKRGATLWDRMQAATAIGYINDQFTKNQRTVRVEERVAFGVRRPKAFAYIQTVAAAP